MNRDSFYCQIIERLNEKLDPELFEQCSTDLLRVIYPGLTPMRGGSDSGMDGAIADGLGEPFPLVATTHKNVIGNLTHNLNTYIREGHSRRLAVLATSHPLTPRKKQNLYARARELDFELVNIHDQDALANLLYHSPAWCLELLNLPSNPPPLSKVPRTERPLLHAPLIGREAALPWLRQTGDDRILIGQPGAGKTFLLHQLAQEGAGLFLVSSERDDIAAGIRAQQPTAIFVDDAARNRDLLLTLRQMREEMGVGFAIIATGWPGDQASLAQALNLPSARIHQLELLTRDEIVQVVYGVGVRGPNRLVREIVNQAEGRPGLAVTLALLCLQGGVREVVLGDVLSASVRRFVEPLVGQQAVDILAVLALAGDAGLPLQAVANVLNLPLIEVRLALVQLAAGGMVMDLDGQRLTVRPPALRYALVRDGFFQGALSIPIEPILAHITNRVEVALTLIGARGRGTAIRDHLLRRLVEEARSAEVWEAYAWLGREEAEWVLRQYPDQLATIVSPGLTHAAEAFLPSLLKGAVGDRRPLHTSPDHLLRRISDWVVSASPGTGEAFRRRRLLLDVTERWLPNNGDGAVVGQALQIALSPRFENRTTDPGQGLQVSLRRGTVSPNDLRQIQTLWPRVLNLITHIPVADRALVHRMLEDWAYPGRHNPNLPEDIYIMMRAFATQMLQDVIAWAEQRPGTLHWAQHVARHLGADLAIPLNAEFEILYPLRVYEDNWSEADERKRAAVSDLAERWSRDDPEDIARRLTHIETEASIAGVGWPRWTPFLCAELAAHVVSCLGWARALMTANLSGDLIFPFLQRAAEANEEGWQTVAFACLDQPNTRGAAIQLVLTLPHVPEDLLTKVLTHVDAYTEYVRRGGARREIPEYQTRRLLQHPASDVACAAAEGIWHASNGRIPDSLRDEWRVVVLQSVTDSYWLSEVLRADPELACQWLQARLTDENLGFFPLLHEKVIQSAVSGLSEEMRRALLLQIPNSARNGFVKIITRLLIEGHPALYLTLLSNEKLRWIHLAPLLGTPEGGWLEKALMAVEAGYSPDDIARAVYSPIGGTMSWGNESAMWLEWMEHFERLCAHEDEHLRRIGEAGKAQVSHLLEDARRRERHEAVYGLS